LVKRLIESGLKVFATCPPSYTAAPLVYRREVLDVARWSDAAGCEGILIYTDNGLVDPWLVAQEIITHTQRLSPLVAVQPVYMHPYSVAKMVATLGFLHGRRVYLNMVAGGFKNDLEALDDPTPHDERYTRLVEYTSAILELLSGSGPVTRRGRYYRITNVKMTPPLDPALRPGVFVSGSSEAGLAAARELGALAVRYPRPVSEYEATPPIDAAALGIRIGIIARERAADAWAVAQARFPEDRKGQLTHQLAMKVSDSEWHRQLSSLGKIAGPEEDQPYWMVPFENYKTFCPYLVGSYERVADEVARYVGVGYRTIILDVPASPQELEHIGAVCERAAARVTS
jgi:alkanesulfonate monooxygenase